MIIVIGQLAAVYWRRRQFWQSNSKVRGGKHMVFCGVAHLKIGLAVVVGNHYLGLVLVIPLL